jgi:hypothetical protein
VEDYASDREPPERRGGGGGRPAPHGWPFGRAARLCRLPRHRRTAAQATNCAAQRSGAQAYTGDAMVLSDAVRLRALVTRHRLSSEQPRRSGTPTSAMLAPRVPPLLSTHESMGRAATVAYKQLTAPCPSQPQGHAVWQASPCAPCSRVPSRRGHAGSGSGTRPDATDCLDTVRDDSTVGDRGLSSSVALTQPSACSRARCCRHSDRVQRRRTSGASITWLSA